MPRNQEYVDRLYGRTSAESKSRARFNSVRFKNEDQNLLKNFGNEIQNNIEDHIDEFAKKQALETARRIDEIKKIAEEDQFIKDTKTFRDIVQGSKIKAPIEAIKLALTSRKAVKEHQKHAWTMPFVVALAMDGIISIVSAAISTVLPVPVFSPGKLMLLCGWLYLFIFLWGTKAKLKVRLIMWACGLIEVLIPFISLLPFSTFAVYVAYRQSEKEYEKGKAYQEKFNKQFPDMSIEQA